MSAALPDLNLLVPLDVLLAEGSVAAAARRLGLSPSATSRALTRLREVTGDPLLVRAGRKMVPTPRALELREELGPWVAAALAGSTLQRFTANSSSAVARALPKPLARTSSLWSPPKPPA